MNRTILVDVFDRIIDEGKWDKFCRINQKDTESEE
jgi:hypothetical protein